MPFQWVAHYKDETQLRQYADLSPLPDESNAVHSFEDIDREKIGAIQLMDEEQNTIVLVPVPEGARFICRARREKPLAINKATGQVAFLGEHKGDDYVVWIIGIEEPLNERDGTPLLRKDGSRVFNSHILLVYPDGHIETSRKFNTGHPLLRMSKDRLVAGEAWESDELPDKL